MENGNNWEYETKCRRCGEFHKWHFASKAQIEWMGFANAIQDHINSPRQMKCNSCDKKTVQDVVSYSEPY